MNDKIYPRLSIDHWKRKVELASTKRVLQEFKDMDNKSNGLEPCGLSFGELMKELKS